MTFRPSSSAFPAFRLAKHRIRDRRPDQRFAGDGRPRLSANAGDVYPGARPRAAGSSNASSAAPSSSAASADQFSLSNETLAIPLVTEDQHLLDTLQPICDAAAKERNTAHGTLRSLVENEVQKLLPHGKANRRRVAKALGLSERTLSQKLAEEDTSYERGRRSFATKSRARIHQGTEHFARADCVVARATRGRLLSTMLSRAGRADRRQRRAATISVQATVKCRSWAAPP